jgi:single-strand DNA-binding protein
MARTSTTTRARKPKATSPAPSEAPQYPPDTVLVGRLVADPVLRTTSSGRAVSTIRIAVNADAQTSFHNVVVWNRTAEVVCRYLKKGRLVEVRGRAQERTWRDRDGNERRANEISAYRVQFLASQPPSPVAASAAEELS